MVYPVANMSKAQKRLYIEITRHKGSVLVKSLSVSKRWQYRHLDKSRNPIGKFAGKTVARLLGLGILKQGDHEVIRDDETCEQHLKHRKHERQSGTVTK